MTAFGELYSNSYDAIYGEKDYELECDLVEKLARAHGGNPSSVLDIGCGTGRHAVALAQRGYRVTGVDLSAPMLMHARDRARTLPEGVAAPEFVLGDARSFRLDATFDIAIMMFAVIGYQATNIDMASALQTVRTHLQPGGLFVFDFWFGPAVLAQRPGDRLKVIPHDRGEIIRAATSDVDYLAQICTVTYRLWHVQGDRLLGHTQERHEMRFMFPQELRFALAAAAFELLSLRAFDDPDREPTTETWNAVAVARAV